MTTNSYQTNGRRFGWGPGNAKINPDKASLLKKYAKGKCLDLGFGSGIYSKFLYDDGHKVIGVDNQAAFIKKAARNYPELKFIKSDADSLPFGDNQFDTVVAFDILEHLDDGLVTKEIFRVAKRLVFSVPHQNQKILLKYGLSHAHYLDQTHLRTYTTSSIKKLFPSNKYRLILLKKSLPLSISGLLINQLSKGNLFITYLLRIILKPFLPEPQIYSTIFGVIDIKKKK